MIPGREATDEETDEFFAKVFSNPLYEAKETVPLPDKPPDAPKNLGLLKNLGKKHYQGVLDEIRTEMEIRTRLDRNKNEPQGQGNTSNVSHIANHDTDQSKQQHLLSVNSEETAEPRSNYRTEHILHSKYFIEGIKFRRLGESDHIVSEIGIGTSMYDNPELIDHDHALEILETAHKQYGINFFDTCEFDPYPYEPRSYLEGQHRCLREFLKRTNREDVVLSGRISSSNIGKFRTSGRFLSWVRDDISSPPNLKVIEGAVDKLLSRLNTDYLDILSFVHPYRYVTNSHLGEDTYCWANERDVYTSNNPKNAEDHGYDANELLEAQCEIFEALVAKGKVRSIGLSNETVWGVFHMKNKLPRKFKLACTQQMYNLLHRNEVESSGMSEAVLKDNLNCPLVAYGVLAGGILTGKYIDPQRHNPTGADKTDEKCTLSHTIHYPRDFEIPEDYGHLHFGPANARCNLFPDTYHTHRTIWCQHATAEYLKIARTHGMTLSQLSLNWALTRPFIASTLVAPRSIGQLHETTGSLNYKMTKEIERDIHEVFLRYRAPTMGGPQLLTRLDDDFAVPISQNQRMVKGSIPIWSGGSHWDMDTIPSLTRIAEERQHDSEYVEVKSLFGLLDKPNDTCWKNYRCWVERTSEGLPGEFFAVKESKLFGWDTMKLEEFTVVYKTPEEIARDDTSDFHFYWKGGKVYVGPTTDAIREFYNDRIAVLNVMKAREESLLQAAGLTEPPEDFRAWTQLDVDLVFKRLKEKFGIDITEPQTVERLLLQCGRDAVALSEDERRCAQFAYFEDRKHVLEEDVLVYGNHTNPLESQP
ncbi:NADH-specific methylglyoxal reductase-related protein [Babesia gibsoni]|uniref:NADH-specific methylglyoxal reductase-related protein n=1 Tax=Babesia gibsoni TaxID=33632 RepID=A0AAD8USJ4_BABGI|nr:NADH-specific methylglyoxal reductase-related protein [Babesia gibsoni]